MKVVKTPLEGVVVIEPDIFRDERGFLFESYHQKKYHEAGLPERFVQDNHSRSQKGILRGLHAQLSRPQGKMVRVLRGEVFDVVVDIRPGSPTYKRWYSVTLSEDNFRQLYVPPGFAHGFCALSDLVEMEYKVTDFYDSSDELHLLWNDPDLAIRWPIREPILSSKDKNGVRLREIEARLQDYNPPK